MRKRRWKRARSTSSPRPVASPSCASGWSWCWPASGVTERLARAQGDVSYRQLYDVLKGESFIAGSGSEGYRANVRTLVKRIRQKFCDVDEQFAAIVSVPGFGYRWREGAPDGQA